jgi:hypothetical protein
MNSDDKKSIYIHNKALRLQQGATVSTKAWLMYFYIAEGRGLGELCLCFWLFNLIFMA